MAILTKIRELVDLYSAFILDIWGVLHDGEKLYPGAKECLDYFKLLNKPFMLMSNAPRPYQVVLAKLHALGLPVTAAEIITSGDVFRQEAQHKDYGLVYHLGSNRNQDILEGLCIKTTEDLSKAQHVLLSAFIDEGEELSGYDALLQMAYARNLVVTCVNPDKVVFNAGKKRYCSGFIAGRYEALGGRVEYYGKPYEAIYKTALATLGPKVLMIGDTTETDIAGARRMGIDSALVATGNGRELDALCMPTWRLHDLSCTEANN